MRYKVLGREIRSENAAKPASSASRWVLKWIRGLSSGARGLDIGCGKLRYTIPLARQILSVTAVDSAVQVNRKQKLKGKVCSVREYARRALPNVRVCAFGESLWRSERYDVVICTNVLSAIPCRRTRKQLIKRALRSLNPGGTLLVTTQFKNSHYSSWKTSPNAKPYMDGFIVESRQRTSFYGLIDARALTRLCRSSGFDVVDSGHVRELAYVLAVRG